MLDRLDKTIFRVIELLIALLLINMFVVIIIGVFTRYILKNPTFGVDELARYLMFYMVMLGSAVAFRKKIHPALSFIIERFSARVLKIWNIIKDIIIISVLIIILRGGVYYGY